MDDILSYLNTIVTFLLDEGNVYERIGHFIGRRCRKFARNIESNLIETVIGVDNCVIVIDDMVVFTIAYLVTGYVIYKVIDPFHKRRHA